MVALSCYDKKLPCTWLRVTMYLGMYIMFSRLLYNEGILILPLLL